MTSDDGWRRWLYILTRSTVLSAERFQYRVGHGGFHATIVQGVGNGLTYVYDVGAHPAKALLRGAITDFIGTLRGFMITRVDFVFISHIDQDHVNGITELLDGLKAAQIDVETVVLPWLSPVEKLLTQTRSSHRQGGTAVARLTRSDDDADGYLRDYGVKEVVRVVGEDQQDSPDGGTGPGGRSVRTGTPLSPSTTSSWDLIPLRLTPPTAAIQTFRSEVRANTPYDPDDLTTHAALLRHHRGEIRKAMRTAAGSVPGVSAKEVTNWSSLALYSGAGANSAVCAVAANAQGVRLSCTHGWLHTGDLPLGAGAAWKEFHQQMTAAAPALPLCVVVAPHHGSHISHHNDLYVVTRPKHVLLTTGRTRGGKTAKGINADPATEDAEKAGATVTDLHN